MWQHMAFFILAKKVLSGLFKRNLCLSEFIYTQSTSVNSILIYENLFAKLNAKS